jgi:ATP-binding cassette subfamily F protein 3
MFGGEASDKKVKVLSGGEKTRLAMIRLLLEPVNLLILDEPTNHLDMATKDILKQAIKDFDGTVIVVSHDREFLDGLVEKVYEFGGGKVRECLGGIYEFLEKKKLASLAELERTQPVHGDKNAPAAQKASAQKSAAQATASASGDKSASEATVKAGRVSYTEQRERQRMVKRAEKKVADAEAQIADIEAQIADVEAKIAAGDVEREIFDRHAALGKQLDNAMSLWELAGVELEELKQSLGV